MAAAPKTRVGKIDYKAPVTEHVAHHDTCQSVTHGGDRVALALQAHGVRLLFALCGGHISPILVGAKARGLQVVDVRDEATSVFAADAVARLTGAPGVAAVTAGPGVANTLTALKDAQLAQSPVVVLVGAAPTALQDNLNIHSKASLYEAFPAAEPRRLVERFEWHYTPKHGTYLPNQANPPLPSRLRGNERNKLYPFLNPRRRSILPMRRSSSTGLGHSPD